MIDSWQNHHRKLRVEYIGLFLTKRSLILFSHIIYSTGLVSFNYSTPYQNQLLLSKKHTRCSGLKLPEPTVVLDWQMNNSTQEPDIL
jgi:hypothetical protein